MALALPTLPHVLLIKSPGTGEVVMLVQKAGHDLRHKKGV